MIKRGKQKIPVHYGMLDYYKHYCKTSENPVSRHTFSEIHKEINDEVMKAIREENFIYVLPSNMGKIRIKKFRPKIQLFEDGSFQWKNQRVDYKKTWDYWRNKYPGKTDEEIIAIPNKHRIYHTNFHTSGYRYRYVWERSIARLRGKTGLALKIVRDHTRALAAWLHSHESSVIDYFE